MPGIKISLYERSQKNPGGVTANSSNTRFRSRAPMPPPEPEAEPAVKPPNLRDSTEQMGSCATCMNYAAMKCVKYGDFPVSPNKICDSFESAEEGEMEAEDTEEEYADRASSPPARPPRA